MLFCSGVRFVRIAPSPFLTLSASSKSRNSSSRESPRSGQRDLKFESWRMHKLLGQVALFSLPMTLRSAAIRDVATARAGKPCGSVLETRAPFLLGEFMGPKREVGLRGILTPALPCRERRCRQPAGREYPTRSVAGSADCGFSLSQRERAGVRENGATCQSTSCVLNDLNFKSLWVELGFSSEL